MQRKVVRVEKHLIELASAKGNDRLLPSISLEKQAGYLAEESPGHPLLATAHAALGRYRDDIERERAASAPVFTEIGRVDSRCPYCEAALAPRPQRKKQCPACGNFVFVKKRPLDSESVLLRQDQLDELEKQWFGDYEVKAAQPRPISPEWEARINEARAAGPDNDPKVEQLAQTLFQQFLAACLTKEAPRDAEDRLLATIADSALRAKVERRIWQLKVQYM